MTEPTVLHEYVPRPEHFYIIRRLESTGQQNLEQFVEVGRFYTRNKDILLMDAVNIYAMQALIRLMFELYASRKPYAQVLCMDNILYTFSRFDEEIPCSARVEDLPDLCFLPSRNPKGF